MLRRVFNWCLWIANERDKWGREREIDSFDWHCKANRQQQKQKKDTSNLFRCQMFDDIHYNLNS